MDRITLSHGSGGELMHELIDSLFMKHLGNPVLRQKKDSAIVKVGGVEIAFTTDSYVVDPVFFPGGDIGSLAVFGTVNDLAVCGARPSYISLGLIIEEGLKRETLERIILSIKNAAGKAAVAIVTGDTKVVGKGACDRIYINTSGVGSVYYRGLSLNSIRPGDAVIISGGIGEHAVSILSKREGLEFKTRVKSDSAPLNALIARALKVSRKVRFMRDPTRGGLATTLNELVSGGRFGIAVDEKLVPAGRPVAAACELLGLDPLYLACEGRVVVVAAKEDASRVVKAMRAGKDGLAATVIGAVTKEHKGIVYLNTTSGGRRILAMLSGEQLPRIC